MKDYERNVFGSPDQGIDVRFKEVPSWLVETVFDVPSRVIVISDVHHQIVFVGNFLAFYQLCELLF